MLRGLGLPLATIAGLSGSHMHHSSFVAVLLGSSDGSSPMFWCHPADAAWTPSVAAAPAAPRPFGPILGARCGLVMQQTY